MQYCHNLLSFWFGIIAQASIRALYSPFASLNLSVTTSHKSIKSVRPFSNASTAGIGSVESSDQMPLKYSTSQTRLLTVGLDPDIHEFFGRMRYRVTAKLDIRTDTTKC